MAPSISFPDDRKLLQIWNLNANHTYVDAVLLYPPRGKYQGQRVMILEGSKLKGAESRTCPANAKIMRQNLISLGPVEKH